MKSYAATIHCMEILSYSDTTQMKPLKQYLEKILPTTRQACQKCAGNRRYRRLL